MLDRRAAEERIAEAVSHLPEFKSARQWRPADRERFSIVADRRCLRAHADRALSRDAGENADAPSRPCQARCPLVGDCAKPFHICRIREMVDELAWQLA
ncbi:MAG TPA: hypothetical protein VFQ53_20440 [Kofleriaceae bacterium]|nr:hypothetical protein [Kofleriaceae bacterium]